METGWYSITENGEVEGPLSAVMLKARADSRIVKPDTPVRNGAEGKWVPAGGVKGLFATPPPPPSIPKATTIQWYVTIEGEQKGPLTDAELKRWVTQRKVEPDTFVRPGIDGQWTPANEVPGLLPSPPHAHKTSDWPSASQVSVPPRQVSDKMPMLWFLAVVGALLLIGLIVWGNQKAGESANREGTSDSSSRPAAAPSEQPVAQSSRPKYDQARVEALKAEIARHRFNIEDEQRHPCMYHSELLDTEQRLLWQKEMELESILREH
jgi:hypothetical protein